MRTKGPYGLDGAPIVLPTRRATLRLAQWLATQLRPSDLLVLKGPLGSGKTFLTRAVLRALGVPRLRRITSPTFTLVERYDTATHSVVHCDLYRIQGTREFERDLHRLGLNEELRAGSIVIIEWGEHFNPLGLARRTFVVELTNHHDTRSIRLNLVP